VIKEEGERDDVILMGVMKVMRCRFDWASRAHGRATGGDVRRDGAG
jgi:hypothetical protein